MSHDDIKALKPFLSLVIIVTTLFTVAFMKMEVRRLGYMALKTSKQYKTLKDQRLVKTMELARITRPDHVRSYAMSRLTLSEARNGQIIQLSGSRIAVPQ